MTLGLVLLTGNDGRQLDFALPRLGLAVAQGVPLLIVDRGSQDGTLERLAAFVQGPGRGARLLELEAPELNLAAAMTLARQELGSAYILGVTGRDLLCPEALEALRWQLKARTPDLAVCAQGWWQTGAGVPLAPADAGRLVELAAKAAPDPVLLRPDPRRLLPSAELALRLESSLRGSGPLAAWDIYDAWTEAADRILVHPEPVLLQELPKSPLQRLFRGLAQRLGEPAGRRDRMRILEQGLLRIGQEMRFCDPAEAAAEIAAAQELLRGLNWADRRRAAAAGGPAGELLAALRRGRHGLSAARSVLTQQAAAEDRRRLEALAGEIRALRQDLDLALPGPDYLRDLYERVRNI